MQKLFHQQKQEIIAEMKEITKQELSVQRFDIAKDTNSIVDAKLKPIQDKLDRLFKMESEDVGESYKEIKILARRLKIVEAKLGLS